MCIRDSSYLEHYIKYGDEQVRQQIQAVYDAGYDEWILWDAGVSYHYGGLLTPEAAAKEDEHIAQSRAAAEQAGAAAENAGAGDAAAEQAGTENAEAEDSGA